MGRRCWFRYLTHIVKRLCKGAFFKEIMVFYNGATFYICSNIFFLFCGWLMIPSISYILAPWWSLSESPLSFILLFPILIQMCLYFSSCSHYYQYNYMHPWLTMVFLISLSEHKDHKLSLKVWSKLNKGNKINQF